MIYDNKNHQHLMKDVSILDIGVIFSFPDTNICGQRPLAGAKIIQGTQSDKSGHNTKLKATIFTEQSVPTSPVL